MKKIYFTILILFTCFSSFAQSVDSLYKKGNELYAQGQFKDASDTYELILKKDKESSYLYYNLGNAYFKQNNIAAAILNYERAARLNPSDGDIKHNIEFARTQLQDKFEPVPEAFFVTFFNNIKNIFTANTWGTLALITFAITLILVSLFLFSQKIYLRRLSFWLAAAFLLFSISAKFIELNMRNNKEAIIFAPVVTVKSSPDDNGKELYLLHEGTKVKVKDIHREWRKIKLPNGNEGWVTKENIEVI